jgi:hypothetical protein
MWAGSRGRQLLRHEICRRRGTLKVLASSHTAVEYAVATHLPSGLNATELTQLSCRMSFGLVELARFSLE